MTRHDGRGTDQLRSVEIQTGFQRHPMGSVLIKMGHTHVICAASVEERVPAFLAGAEEGWVTAEYSMLPSSTNSRARREVSSGRASGRTMEIQRLIGRSMRSVVDRSALGERTLWLDCDVIQADGGTRTASITGAFVAMALAADRLLEEGKIRRPLFNAQVAAISVGVVKGVPVLDLDYVEDSNADTDMNVVSTERGGYIEVQGTAEGEPFPRAQLEALLGLADEGIAQLAKIQRDALGGKLSRLLGANAAQGE